MTPLAKLSHDHVAEIGRMLHQWSPNETWPAHGETANVYGPYALDVYGLLRDGQDVHRVASYLGRIRTAEIGVPPDPDSDRKTAQQIIEWWNGQ